MSIGSMLKIQRGHHGLHVKSTDREELFCNHLFFGKLFLAAGWFMGFADALFCDNLFNE